MKETYDEAMARVYEDEGGYSNDRGDPGGPTKYGITIHDARMYWKPNATAADVKAMPKSVAADIYRKHYAAPIHYDDLPAGVDYAVFDYGINSGVSRSVKVLQRIVGVKDDGALGPITLAAVHKKDPNTVIKAIYDERLRFLKSLRTWSIFGKGWGRRVSTGKAAALDMSRRYNGHPTAKPSIAAPVVATTGAVLGTAAAASAMPHIPDTWLWVGGGVSLIGLGGLAYYLYKRYTHV